MGSFLQHRYPGPRRRLRAGDRREDAGWTSANHDHSLRLHRVGLTELIGLIGLIELNRSWASLRMMLRKRPTESHPFLPQAALACVQEPVAHLFECLEPKGMLVQAWDKREVLAPGAQKGFAAANADFLERFQAI